ncbi:aromatic ring-hydroxylating dioxygenase subunit alpha [Leptolyngbya sp. FACHB-321]|uniref:aromatic ring-hydroxylating dioxygenase subunit alpha n=1 Tax=Leptolyngbya sp. FACHB-321 TaxID=2692807 RepID=UPI00168521A0|nr:aromatic ring-hydroxylating dioxygenase subunit alpha [Leptolyngbya sp. FACHB-321]MBD2034399.1 aromatic ring-hydroxylating dioxygenase subunit alpha [Leptolyngbya sp. FACHB-321]
MLVTQQPILKRFWYPVMPIADLAVTPQSFQLLGEPLALWLNGVGKPAAVRDRCCHRSARLSLGVVVNDAIRCPYHGWSFDAEGTCTNVPQLSNGTIPKTYRVDAFRCQERYGYVWVCLEEPLMAIPNIPEATDPQFRQIPEFYETWHCAGLRLMENSFDNAHPHFVHAKTFGVEQEPVPPQPDSFTETEFGFRMRYVLPVFNSDLQKQNLQMEAGRTVRISEGTWFMPFIRTLKITYPNGLIHLIFTAATPIDDCSSQIVQFCLRNDTEEAVTAESVVAFDRAVTLEDRMILEGTDYDVPLSLSAEQHMATDKPGIVMRRKLAALVRNMGNKE